MYRFEAVEERMSLYFVCDEKGEPSPRATFSPGDGACVVHHGKRDDGKPYEVHKLNCGEGGKWVCDCKRMITKLFQRRGVFDSS